MNISIPYGRSHLSAQIPDDRIEAVLCSHLESYVPPLGERELVEAALTLEEGQCSGILETEAGFSILRRLPLETSVLKEAYFDHLLETAAENSAVTTAPEYVSLDAAEFAERFLTETEPLS